MIDAVARHNWSSVNPQQHEAPQPQREPFWQSMAGMITAIAGLITALVGVGALIYQIKGSDPADPPSSTSANAPTGAAVRTTGPAREAPADAGEGPFLVPFTNSGVDLDANPPKAPAKSAMDIYDGGGRIVSVPAGGLGLAKWTQPGSPSRAECIDALESSGIGSSAFTKGSKFCVRTRDNRRYAFVEFVKQTEGTWTISVSLWPGDQS